MPPAGWTPQPPPPEIKNVPQPVSEPTPPPDPASEPVSEVHSVFLTVPLQHYNWETKSWVSEGYMMLKLSGTAQAIADVLNYFPNLMMTVNNLIGRIYKGKASAPGIQETVLEGDPYNGDSVREIGLNPWSFDSLFDRAAGWLGSKFGVDVEIIGYDYSGSIHDSGVDDVDPTAGMDIYGESEGLC
ncbi:MAG: hypothetical protein KKF65_04400 [Nanoarchaeota archaeon]|nr:hypothetical protein [Nanoarchaeota archaeon]